MSITHLLILLSYYSYSLEAFLITSTFFLLLCSLLLHIFTAVVLPSILYLFLGTSYFLLIH